MISVPAVIIGCIGRVKNITCTTDSANWLIVFGCIGIVEAAILITFVSKYFHLASNYVEIISKEIVLLFILFRYRWQQHVVIEEINSFFCTF